MSRLSVIVLAVFIITISVTSLAEPLDESESQGNKKYESDHLESEAEESEHAASTQVYPSISNRISAGSYLPPKVRLVECYACTDCPKVFANTTSKYCPYTNDFTKNNKCIIYSEKYKQMDKPWVIRGCASERGSCVDITRAHENANPRLVKMLYCSECDGDRCNTNGVYRSLPNLTSAILFVILTPIVSKYVMS